MKRRISVETDGGIECAMFIIATCAFLSTGHWIAGGVCGFLVAFIMDSSSKRREKTSSIDNVKLKEAANDYVAERDAEDPMSPFERDAAFAAFRAGAQWLEHK